MLRPLSTHRSSNPPREPASLRRGAALLLVMVGLLVASLILAVLVQVTLRQQRQFRQDVYRVQSHWCAVAGLQRAAQQLALDPAYPGEKMQLKPSAAAHSVPEDALAEVTIVVTAADGDRRQVQVTAVYPHAAAWRVQSVRSLWLATAEPIPVSALVPENVSP